jgi:tRNA pseudouridine38-40 synthase
VQEKLEEALRLVTGVPSLAIAAAAGRTDAGVHARGQVVNFRTEATIPTDRWPHALNSHLPPDIVVTGAEEAPPAFHARFHATGKRYRYTIEYAPFPSPLRRLYAYHHGRPPLDLVRMQEAAQVLVGHHNFAAFRATGGAAKTSTRTVTRCDVTMEGSLIQIDVAADGFLYNMVRIIAGTLLEVGTGKISPAQVREALATGRRKLAGRTLPPHGLCLEEVYYGGEVAT